MPWSNWLLSLRTKSVSGVIPANGVLRQEHIAMTTCEIQDAFNTFWSQYWQRDLVSETQSDEPWHAFVEQMNQVGFPQLPEIDIKLGSASLWMRAIRGLKSGKAEGIDGWRCE